MLRDNMSLKDNVKHVVKTLFSLKKKRNVFAAQDSSLLEEYAQFVIQEPDITEQTASVTLDISEQEINAKNVMDHAVFAQDLRPINANHALTFL